MFSWSNPSRDKQIQTLSNTIMQLIKFWNYTTCSIFNCHFHFLHLSIFFFFFFFFWPLPFLPTYSYCCFYFSPFYFFVTLSLLHLSPFSFLLNFLFLLFSLSLSLSLSLLFLIYLPLVQFYLEKCLALKCILIIQHSFEITTCEANCLFHKCEKMG